MPRACPHLHFFAYYHPTPRSHTPTPNTSPYPPVFPLSLVLTRLHPTPFAAHRPNCRMSEWQRRLAMLTTPVCLPRDDGRATSLPFVTYPRQEMAFTAADDATSPACPAGLPVFAFQRDEGGRREYFCATYADFWRRYYAMQPSHRHVYEVVRAGRQVQLSCCVAIGASTIAGCIPCPLSPSFDHIQDHPSPD